MGELPHDEGDDRRRRTVGLLIVHGIGREETADESSEKCSSLMKRFRKEVLGRESFPWQRADDHVHLYDVYWADILTGRPIVGSFDYKDPLKLGWFPLLNKITRNYRNPRFSIWTVFLWTILLCLIPTGLALTVLYFGAAGLARDRDAFLKLHALLDDYVGDIVNYVNSMGGALAGTPLASCSSSIIDRFERALIRASRSTTVTTSSSWPTVWAR